MIIPTLAPSGPRPMLGSYGQGIDTLRALNTLVEAFQLTAPTLTLSMWRTSKNAADSTRNRLPEDSYLGRKLCAACREGDMAECVRLLDEGASPDSGQSSGYSALGLACNRGHLSVVDLLLARGASPNTPICANEATPLMIAVVWDQRAIVERLLEYRADLTPKGTAGSYRGCDVFDIATQRGRSAILALLKRARAMRRFERLRRLVPALALLAAALRELYSMIHYRPGGDGAKEAHERFERLRLAQAEHGDDAGRAAV